MEPKESPKPVLIFDKADMSFPSCPTPTTQPVSAATRIPVKAPPAINPELNKAPGPSSDSTAALFLERCSMNHFTNPPIKIGLVVEKGRYAPTANARELTPQSSITAATAIPTITRLQGSWWLSKPLMMVDINMACGAASALGCSGVGVPMPRVWYNNNNVNPIAIVAAKTPISKPICCLTGVAPTRYPVFRSCDVAPAFAEAMQTNDPTISAIGWYASPVHPIPTNMRQVAMMVAMVIPEIGLEEEPIIPTIRDDTVTKKNPKITIIMAGNIPA